MHLEHVHSDWTVSDVLYTGKKILITQECWGGLRLWMGKERRVTHAEDSNRNSLYRQISPSWPVSLYHCLRRPWLSSITPWPQNQEPLGSISTHRSSKDQAHHRPLHLRGVTGPSSESSFLSPNVTNSHISIGKRFSFGGWQQGGRVSFSGLYLQQPIQEIHLKNTYRMGPEPGSHFSVSRTQQIIKATLDSYLDGVCYSPDSSSQLCQMLADLTSVS
ncbi:uncharacterized protein LOC127441174 [Myxocyprinus asiaticus]|uniref:uncharacterized protein LOC127441174 n=1 Tax=Myxocyprinus asiaticus TaxID=70543 RepID=UPI002223581D|nr:uncharacterized protein LOC127441174 [Myxocyprinus asiaticus]